MNRTSLFCAHYTFGMFPYNGGWWIAFSGAVKSHSFPINPILVLWLNHKLRRDCTETNFVCVLTCLSLAHIQQIIAIYNLTSNNELTLVLNSGGLVAGDAGVVAIVVGCQVGDPQ